jgi:TPP-dependent pyruvate/acetoin dehydrogenase alpha subunit
MLTVENRLLSLYQTVEPDLTREFFRQMYSIRTFEQRLLDLFAQGLISGTVHTSLGQESCDVGVIQALDKTKDVIFSNHRAHGQFIAYCDDIEGLLAEIMERATGVCQGIGGSQHIHKFNMYTNGVQGGTVPNAVGAALAEKLKGSESVVVVFIGDGTMGEGIVYESMNMASLWSLPVLFVLEDNGIAQSTPRELEHAGDLTSRADSFGIASASICSEDVLEVYQNAANIVAEVRCQWRPFFLHVETMRFGPHSKGDDTRSKEEIDALRQRDPLLKLAAQVPAGVRQAIEASVEQRLQAAVEQAAAAAYPVLKPVKPQVA